MRAGIVGRSCLFVLAALLASGVLVAAETPAAAPAPTVGLAVEPGGLLLQDVTPGELYDLAAKTGIMLTIHNRDRNDHTYVISSHRPSEVGNRRVPPGYSDIVDPSWLWFEQSEVRVPAQGASQVRMFLRIPDDERYHNQHCSVSVGVVGKPEPGETLTLAVYPRFEIETAASSREELRLRPAGAIAFAPSVLTLRPRGAGLVGEFVVCNNDSRRHQFKLWVASRGELGDGRQLFPSGGYEWLPENDWVALRRPAAGAGPGWSAVSWPALWLGGCRHAAIPVEVKLPEGVSVPELGWEAVVVVQREDGQLGFVRVRTPGGGKAS